VYLNRCRSSLQYLALDRGQKGIQRSLLPHIEDLLPLKPVQAILRDSHIEIPQHASEDDSHLHIGKTNMPVNKDTTGS
jgi:hypothetical protein